MTDLLACVMFVWYSRPAYQGELSALETEIASLWEQYVLRYRCVEALRHQLSVLDNTHAQVTIHFLEHKLELYN